MSLPVLKLLVLRPRILAVAFRDTLLSNGSPFTSASTTNNRITGNHEFLHYEIPTRVSPFTSRRVQHALSTSLQIPVDVVNLTKLAIVKSASWRSSFTIVIYKYNDKAGPTKATVFVLV